MNSNFKDILALFNAKQVEYLVVGGMAFIFYAEPRYTKDIDIWVHATPENAVRVFKALAEFGVPMEGLTPDDFAQEGYFFTMGLPPVRVDILNPSCHLSPYPKVWHSFSRHG
ncbi:MAG: hypothetical protein IT210_09735 [Armatimonadetes bacterium]|nr:hypothetical protein [Armatimonadota bacterium]